MTDDDEDGDDGFDEAAADGAPPRGEADWARRAALYYLERYASSEANLLKVLRRKQRRRRQIRGDPPPAGGTDEAVLAAAVGHCRDLGLLDDHRFAEARVASGRRKGLSAARIAAGLAAKGVERGTTAAAIAGEGTDDRTAVVRFAQRRRLGAWRTRPPADARDADRRDTAALCRAGFAPGLARWAVGLAREEAEAVLAGAGEDGEGA